MNGKRCRKLSAPADPAKVPPANKAESKWDPFLVQYYNQGSWVVEAQYLPQNSDILQPIRVLLASWDPPHMERLRQTWA